MNFADLYHLAEALPQPPVGFDFLRQRVTAFHHGIGEVRVYAVTYPEANGEAHYRLGHPTRTSPYEDEFDVAEITYCDSLEGERPILRYLLTKELMHVFDAPDERVDTVEKFKQLLHEIQNTPLERHQSDMYKSELNTRWMALLVLCPKKYRDELLPDYRSGALADFDIAAKFEIPEGLVQAVMDDYYNQAYEAFVNGNGNGH